MSEFLQRQNPWWAGLKAAARPFSNGLLRGAFVGALIGVVTATIFAAIDIAWPGAGSVYTSGSGLFGEMAGFTSYKIQIFFNSVITAGVLGINDSYAKFNEAKSHAEFQNHALDMMEGKAQSIVKVPEAEASIVNPARTRVVEEILQQKRPESQQEQQEQRRLATSTSDRTIH